MACADDKLCAFQILIDQIKEHHLMDEIGFIFLLSYFFSFLSFLIILVWLYCVRYGQTNAITDLDVRQCIMDYFGAHHLSSFGWRRNCKIICKSFDIDYVFTVQPTLKYASIAWLNLNPSDTTRSLSEVYTIWKIYRLWFVGRRFELHSTGTSTAMLLW